MNTLYYNETGLHLMEMFADPSLFDMLPGLLPTDTELGDEWDVELELN